MTKKEFTSICPTLAKSKSWMLEKNFEGSYKFNFHAQDYKTERGFINYLKRLEENERAELSAVIPEQIHFEITWAKNRTWGNCPRLECWCNGEYFTTYASGYGYDKGSTVLAEACNKFLRSALWAKRRAIKAAPYGISKNSFTFEGGVGLNCYTKLPWIHEGKTLTKGGIFDFLGYKVEHHEGKTYDSITIIKK